MCRQYIKYIDVDNKKSYPKDLINYIEEIKDKVELGKYGDFDVLIPENIIDIVNKNKILVYHCTCCSDKRSFEENGIMIPNKSPKLRKILINSCNADIQTISDEEKSHRGNSIHFVFSYKFINECIYLSPFFEHIGGEIIEKTYDYKPTIGIPYIVIFVIDLSELCCTYNLIQRMIKYYLYDIPVDCSGFIFEDVKNTQIIKIKNANKIMKKLKEMN